MLELVQLAGLGSDQAAAELADDGLSCVVCMNAASTHAFVPCGHRVLCESCAAIPNLDLCPLCRTQKSGIIRIFDV